jgi:very-short-patch-repair endonuclease
MPRISFASHEKAQYWSTKNTKDPHNVSLKSAKKCWFDCNVCNHSFSSAPKTVVKGHWCPYCANQAVCGDINCVQCLEKSFASHEKAQYWSNRNLSLPINVLKGSPKKYWFRCDKCPHEFESQLSGITGERNRWCKYCSNQALCNNDDCKDCFDKSFASHEKSQFWSLRNIKTPREIFKKSDSIKYWFKCPKCPHEFEKNCAHILNGSFCPYCASANGSLCTDETCQECFKKSFASHEKAQYWSIENDKSPREVRQCSDDKYWFKCYKCPHEFKSVLKCITKGQWCPYCAEPCKQLCDEKECSYCFDKSFASHERSQYWSFKNVKNAREVCITSGKKFWFKCIDCDKEFETVIASVTKNNTWCPYCVNKTEKKLYDFLKDHYVVICQYRAEWCINDATGIKLPFDFCIIDHKIIIELDGSQHFRQIMNWRTPEEQQIVDHHKQMKANLNSFSMIRISQEDVLFDKIDWKRVLIDNIQDICAKLQPINIYLSSNDKYDIFKHNFEIYMRNKQQ